MACADKYGPAMWRYSKSARGRKDCGTDTYNETIAGLVAKFGDRGKSLWALIPTLIDHGVTGWLHRNYDDSAFISAVKDDCAIQARDVSRVHRHRIAAHLSVQGSTTAIPQSVKSRRLRVASRAPRDRATAAICASNWLIG